MRTIAELLKDKPKGLKLYTPIFGDVCFEGISETEGDIIIVSDCNGVRQRFYADGTYSNIGECLLFPSKESRDWETFRRTTDKMKIEIDYNGSIAVCKVDGKPFKECSNIDRVFALDALYVVKRDYERELSAEETIKTLKKNGTK